jgi:hypothetical protein
MRVTFERSGGFAGLMLTTSIESAALSEGEAMQLRQLVESAKFFQLPAEFPLSAQTDRFQYELTVDMDNQHHTVTVGEENVPETLRPLIDWCMEKARGN